MISVIVLVYNVEKYLAKCLDCVVCQTYKDLDIILVDDGSTDSCGKICDEYAEKDPRIRVIHTANSGVSAARNIGLDNVLPQSEWIAFVDSDDYMDQEMYERLIKASGDSEIVECGLVKEFKEKSEVQSLQKGTYGTEEAFIMLLNGKIRNFAWDKIYRKELFREIRFPIGRDCQDVAIQHKLISACKSVTIIDGNYYHYVQRGNSISNEYRIKNLIDRWLAYYERFEYSMDIPYISQNEVHKNTLLKSLAGYAEAIWEWFYYNPKSERKKALPMIRFISRFNRKNIPLFGFPGMSLGEKTISVLFHSGSKASLALAYFIFQKQMRLSIKTNADELID